MQSTYLKPLHCCTEVCSNIWKGELTMLIIVYQALQAHVRLFHLCEGMGPGFEKGGGGGGGHKYRGHLCSWKKILCLTMPTLPLFTFTSICNVTGSIQLTQCKKYPPPPIHPWCGSHNSNCQKRNQYAIYNHIPKRMAHMSPREPLPQACCRKLVNGEWAIWVRRLASWFMHMTFDLNLIDVHVQWLAHVWVWVSYLQENSVRLLCSLTMVYFLNQPIHMTLYIKVSQDFKQSRSQYNTEHNLGKCWTYRQPVVQCWSVCV